MFLPFSGKNVQICHGLLTFSGENPRIFHDLQKSFDCLRLQVWRIKFALYDGVARKDVCSFLGVGRRQGQLQSGNSIFFEAGPVGRRQGYNCNLGTRDFWWQAQLEGDRATSRFLGAGRNSRFLAAKQSGNSRFLVAGPVGRQAVTAIWELESVTRDFLPVKRRKGDNCNLGTRNFWWQA